MHAQRFAYSQILLFQEFLSDSLVNTLDLLVGIYRRTEHFVLLYLLLETFIQ